VVLVAPADLRGGGRRDDDDEILMASVSVSVPVGLGGAKRRVVVFANQTRSESLPVSTIQTSCEKII